jgi:hypothetical protein
MRRIKLLKDVNRILSTHRIMTLLPIYGQKNEF